MGNREWVSLAKRLVLGVLYHFGIKHGIGAESLCEFFKSVHLETHVGVSANALRQLKHRVEDVIVTYEVSQSEQCQPLNKLGICLGGDETFLDCRSWCWWNWRVGLSLQKLNVRIVSMKPGVTS
ncbi:hypothetical protein Lepto7375DRAFT_0826 [Leptolyngbya sp. PCC 7375]|nr:hypothetical protein Lepto7375DRAFT_0826 [Leptolyngbya sp. PCC 7375]